MTAMDPPELDNHQKESMQDLRMPTAYMHSFRCRSQEGVTRQDPTS